MRMMRDSQTPDPATVKIIKNSVVALKYEVFDARGELFERGTAPYWYLHGGYNGIFPLVEAALAGKDVGEKVRVTGNKIELRK